MNWNLWGPIVVIALALAAVAFFVVRDDRRARPPRRPSGPMITLVVGDITRQKVDAIVNAAKSSLLGGGGVDGAIHLAGGPAILEECRAWRTRLPSHGLRPGLAVHTTAGNLPAEWVIHTVGPRFDADDDRSAVLRSCYTEALRVADTLGVRTVAFPLISAGVYGWPKEDAIVQALTAIRAADTKVESVRLVFFDEPTYRIAHDLALKASESR